MLLTPSVNLHFANSLRPSIPLTFQAVRHNGRQAAVRGRTKFVPEVNLDDYDFRAVIDWVKVRVHLGRQTQFRWIQEILENLFPKTCYVEAVDPSGGKTSATFDMRIQEPRSAARVEQACRAIFAEFGQAAAPLVVAIEISVDAYPKSAGQEARARLLGAMQRTIYTSRDIFSDARSRPRFNLVRDKDPTFLFPSSKGKPIGIDPLLSPESDQEPPVDGTYSLGAKHGPAMVKLMDKVIDRQNPGTGTYIELDEPDKRVRVEVTLHAKELRELGVCELHDLQRFSFTSLQRRYFQFMLPTFAETSGAGGTVMSAVRAALERLRVERFLSTGVVGLIAMRRGRETFRELHRKELRRLCRANGKRMTRHRCGTGPSETFVVYADMNRRVASALWNLQKRETGAWKRLSGC